MTLILIIVVLQFLKGFFIRLVKIDYIGHRLYEKSYQCHNAHEPEISHIFRFVCTEENDGDDRRDKKSGNEHTVPLITGLEQRYHRIGNDRCREMHDNVDGKHRKHIPIPYFRLIILAYGKEHHEAADKETHHDGKFGIDQFGTIVGLRYLYQHQQKCQNGRTDSYNQLGSSLRTNIQ